MEGADARLIKEWQLGGNIILLLQELWATYQEFLEKMNLQTGLIDDI